MCGSRRPLLTVGLAILTGYVLLATFGSLVSGDPVRTDPAAVLHPPSRQHPFGTDAFGRDVLARVVAATRLDLVLGLGIAALSLVAGSLVGVLAGYVGGAADELVMRATDIVLSFPGFVLALILVAVLGDSVLNVLVAVSTAYIPHFVRLTRALALRERELEYVAAARLAGNAAWQVAYRHVLPNILAPSLVQGGLVTGWAILTVSGLAFLGVGIRPPTPEWGVMVAEGANDVITGVWWTSLIPGAMIVLAVMAFHFIADELQELSR